MKKGLSLILFLLWISSCNIKNNQTGYIEKYFYDDGSLKSSITYTDDNIKNGSANYYYKNGEIALKCFYKNNEFDSLYLKYYSNGHLKQKCYYNEGDVIGSVLFYYSNGRLKLYSARDCAGETHFVIKFDSLGNKIKEEGLVISPSLGTPTYKEQYAIGDSIVLQYQIAEPPNYYPKVLIGMYKYTSEERRYLVDSFKEYSLNIFSQAIYKNIFSDTGHYRVVCAGQLFDTLNNSIKEDTALTDFFILSE